MILGCNYWASNAGTEMWRQFDTEVIRKDLSVLKSHGINYLRVFPNWRDFQPVEPLFCGGNGFREYKLTENREPTNRYYLDDEMLEKFHIFCGICEEYDMKLIVGLLTGWMSGRTFTPPALYGRNLGEDPICQYFEQLYIMGLVENLKDEKVIYAWDHGNETGCLGGISSAFSGTAWAQMLSNAVYSVDKSRPLISGFHELSLDKTWRMKEQADLCDMLVTHPYPFWGKHTRSDKNTYIKTTMYSAALSRLYMDIGKKPCLVEEVGTMGPSICNEDMAADFLRINLLSSMANGANGLLWWCAHDQNELMTAPYTWTMVENELGMTYSDLTPKPVLMEMKRLSEIFENFTLPPADVDAVCLLSRGQDNWGIAYVTYILAKQAGLNVAFADVSSEIPDAKAYLLPSISGAESLPKKKYLELKQKVKNGAKLYISEDVGIISGFEELTGNRIIDSEYTGESGTFVLDGKEIPYTKYRRIYLENINSEPQGTELITKSTYGKGEVWFVNFPVETMLMDRNRAFDLGHHLIYKKVFSEELDTHQVKIDNENVALTIHRDTDKTYVVMINHSEKEQKIDLKGATVKEVIYGDLNALKPMDGVIVVI